MFYHISEMTKTTMKLLFRNKGFLFFAVALPIFATLIMNIHTVGNSIVEKNEITELSGADDQVAYLSDYTMFVLKVYDSSGSRACDILLNHLAEEGIFQVFRVDVSEMSEEEVMESAENSAKKDKIGAIIMIDADFPEKLLNNEAGEAVSVYETGEDDRFELLCSSMETVLTQYSVIASRYENEEELETALADYEKDSYLVEKKFLTVDKQDNISSLDVDYEKTNVMGYAFAILSLCFLFSGIMIFGVINRERQNLVYTRIMLTKAGAGSYLASKFIIVIMSTLFQTLVTGAALLFLVKQDNGIAVIQYLFLIFCMGLIFNAFSVCIGMCCHSVLSASYVSFFVWVITALLGGLYFDITYSSDTMQRVAMLMPQRWMLKGAQMMMDGNSYAYPVILTVTAGYLLVIVVIGMLGLNINRKE